MTRVRLQVALIPVLSRLIQKVVTRNELLQLRLDVYNLLGGKVELDDGDPGLLEVREEPELAWLQEQQGAAGGAVGATCGSAYAVDVVAGVVGGVKLYDPVD